MQSLRVQFAQLQYYLREKLWCHAETFCNDMIKQNESNVFRLWRAFCLYQQGNIVNALQEYRFCENKRDVRAAALHMLMSVYRQSKDIETTKQIEGRLKSDQGSTGSLLQAACILWHSGELEKARDTINDLIHIDKDYRDEYTSLQLIKGWIDLSTGRGAYIDNCLPLFDHVLEVENDGKTIDIDAAMGKIAYLERKAQYFLAQELQNKLIVMYPNFISVYIVKARQLMKSEDWDQSSEVIQRVMTKDPHHIEALILKILHSLVREFKPTVVSATITTLCTALQQREPKNAYIFHVCAQCFARLSNGSSYILSVTSQLAQYAVQLAPNNNEYQSEMAYQLMLTKDYKGAHAIYKRTSESLEPSSLLGFAKCLLLTGNFLEAKKKLDQYQENYALSLNAEYLFFRAMYLWRQEKKLSESIVMLDKAVEIHRTDIAAQPTGVELYVRLNPPLIIEMAREYMQHCTSELPEGGALVKNPYAEKARQVLELVIRYVPGNTTAQLYASKIAFIGGEIDKATNLINSCIAQDSTNSEAFLQHAQILQYIGNISGAKQSLEHALALDFEIKDQPQYNLLNGKIQLKSSEYESALQSFNSTIDTMEQIENSKKSISKISSKIVPLSLNEHVTLYLHLSQNYIKLHKMNEAKDVILKAVSLFQNTPQIGRINIALAVIIAQTDVDKALELLTSIPQTSEFYVAARAKMANIYLSQKHDRLMFTHCFEELVKSNPSVQTIVHLGEAYSAIQEPEKAIVSFEKALAMDPNNTDLRVRIGRTLATTHDYQRALKYYNEAVARDANKFSLRQDLAILFWRLGKLEQAINTLKESPVMQNTKNGNQEEISQSVERVTVVLLMYRIYRSEPEFQKNALESLIQARVFQNILVSRLRNEPSDVIAQQHHIAAIISCELGETYLKIQMPDKAVSFFNESLKHEETNDKAMLALAKLYLNKGEVENCEQQCSALLRINPGCEDAIIILADLMFRRNRYEDAAELFLQLLQKKPDNYNAMVQYIQLLRRAGQLNNASTVFANAEKLYSQGQKPDPGLCYSKGLYERYLNNSTEALKQLNMGRFPKDNPFSQRCLVTMVEIFIMPDNNLLWEDTDEEMKDSVKQNLKTAEPLLIEIQDSYKKSILEGYWLAAHKRKDYLEKAVQKFFEVLNDEEVDDAEESNKDESTEGNKANVPALVGMAITLQMMKQTPKTRNYLKRVAKANYNPAEDDDYERGWLLLADIYIQSGKFDLARELLKRATQANNSCSRGWEYMGLIYEKEQVYKDAASHYEKAWKILNEKDPAIGFRLAFNYMKAKKYVQAIDVSRKILTLHPNYPRIQKEVFERSLLLLRY